MSSLFAPMTATSPDGPIESEDGGKTWRRCMPSHMCWIHADRETHLWIAEGFGTYGEGVSPLDALADLLEVVPKRYGS